MADIKSLELSDPASGTVDVRNGVTLTYFLEQFVFECSDALTAVFDLFVAGTRPGMLQWAVVNATSEQWRPVDEAVIKRMRDSLAPVGARKRKFTAFRVNDYGDEAPQYGFTLADRDKDKDQPDSLTLVQMTFPPVVVDEAHVENLCGFIDQCTALLKPVSGYCAPSLLPSESRQSVALAKIAGIALRHPGYDVAVNDLTQLDIGHKVRGARWITLLGPALQERLGGIEQVKRALPKEIEVRDVAGTATIRAGKTPELGDRNQQVDTPLLRDVARLLEPITLFGEVDMLSNFANFDDNLLRRWERRFLD